MGDHTEAFEVDFDPAKISFDQLLEIFWTLHNPARRSGSVQYQAAVFTADDTQHQRALSSRDRVAARLTRFYRAEDYHQKYLLRRRDDLLAEFSGYDPRAFTDSTVAARLNGYLGGHGGHAQLEAELSTFGLTAPNEHKLLRGTR